MKSSANVRRATAARWFWVLILGIALAAAGGLGYQQWKQGNAVKAQAVAPEFKTKQARIGSIRRSASGSVTLIPGQEEELAFTVSGTVVELNVTVGDTVMEGQVLARLGNQEALEAEIKTAEQDLLTAEQELAAFKAKAPANLANAQLKVIKAQQALEDAQGSAVRKDAQRCDEETKVELLAKYNRAVDQLEALGDGGGHADYYLNVLLPQKKAVDQALAAYQACSGYTAYQVASSQINLTAAKALLQQAQEALEVLTKNEGLEPSGLATAENKVATARQALEDAKDDLLGAAITAPFDGTILSVAGKTGDAVEVTARKTSVTFITISDLAHPRLEFNIDESDMAMVAKGQVVEVLFDAFPDRAFHGSVMRLDPTVRSDNGAAYVTGLIELDLSNEKDVPGFPKNLSGSVQIIQAEANDVLLIPIEALREQTGGTYAVYIIGPDGQPALKTVDTGLRDAASVEIKSGLTADDVVVTSAMP